MEENVYQPILKKDGTKRNTDRIEPLKRENRFNIKVWWNLSRDLRKTRKIYIHEKSRRIIYKFSYKMCVLNEKKCNKY